MKTEAQIYRDAIKVLQRDGWCKYRMQDVAGRHCLVDALFAAQGNEYTNWPQLMAVAGDGVLTMMDSTINFNNLHCETIDDAIAALEIAADLAS